MSYQWIYLPSLVFFFFFFFSLTDTEHWQEVRLPVPLLVLMPGTPQSEILKGVFHSVVCLTRELMFQPLRLCAGNTYIQSCYSVILKQLDFFFFSS